MDILKKIQRRSMEYVVEVDLERAYAEKIIESMKVQLYTVKEDGEDVTVFKLMVILKGYDHWMTLSSRRYQDAPREFRDYNTIVKHVHNRYPEIDGLQISFKPENKTEN